MLQWCSAILMGYVSVRRNSGRMTRGRSGGTARRQCALLRQNLRCGARLSVRVTFFEWLRRRTQPEGSPRETDLISTTTHARRSKTNTL